MPVSHFQELLYITRGNMRPQGKPRVYFTCHPADFSLYFHEIASDILSLQDCAIFYKPDAAACFANPEQMDELLSQMQLFVLPISTALLTQKSSAMDEEVAYAKAHHIPILPLMEEENLDDLFTKRFGTLQYLSPHSTDTTAIRYEKKLGQFLENVLVGDELAKQIRASFDAHIFLSYRKKDRRKAQETMKLIHQRPAFQDVAIWYDEYLVPGEEFNEAILTAMRQSRLFALVVTPNLVNEDNYVMQQEYPAAKKMDHLGILPIEMQPTNRYALRNKYPGIPDCVDGHNNTRLNGALEKHLQGIASPENNQDARHLYLIGMAYLNGVDVEVNMDRAVALLQNSASLHCPDAMEQLAFMYANGVGVDIDAGQTIHWYEQAAAYHRSHGDFFSLCSSLLDLGEFCVASGHLNKAKAALDEMEQVATEHLTNEKEQKTALTMCYEQLALLHDAAGNVDDMQDYNIRKAELLFGDLTNAQWNAETFPELYTFFFLSAAYHREKNNADKALEAYRIAMMAVEESQKMGLIPSDLAQARKARILSEQGRTAFMDSRYSMANSYLQEAIRLYTAMAEEAQGEAESRLAACYGMLGYMEIHRGQYTKGRQLLNKAVEMMNGSEADVLSIHRIIEQSRLYLMLAEAQLGQGHLDDARKTLKKHQDEMRKASHAITSKGVQNSYVNGLSAMADMESTAGNTKEAIALYQETIELLEEMTQAYPDDRHLAASLVKMHYLMGDVYLKNTQPQEAMACYRKCECVFRSTRERLPAFSMGADESILFERMGLAGIKSGDLDTALQHYRSALKVLEEACSSTQCQAYHSKAWAIYLNMGEIAVNKGNYAAAGEYYRLGFEQARCWTQLTDGEKAQTALCTMYDRMGAIELLNSNISRARIYFQKALDQCLKLNELSQSKDARLHLCQRYRRLAEVADQTGDMPQAQHYFTKMKESLEEVNKHTSSQETQLQLAQADAKLAEIFYYQSQYRTARTLALESLRIRQQYPAHSLSEDEHFLLVENYRLLACCEMQLGAVTRKDAYITACLFEGEKLFHSSQSMLIRSVYPNALYLLGVTAYETDDFSTARTHLEKAILVYRQMKPTADASTCVHAAAHCHFVLADMAQTEGNDEEAFRQYAAGAQWADQAPPPENAALCCALAEGHRCLAIAYHKRKQYEKAEHHITRCFAMAMPWAEQTQDTDATTLVMQYYLFMHTLCQDKNNPQEARRFARLAQKTAARLLSCTTDPEEQAELQAIISACQTLS